MTWKNSALAHAKEQDPKESCGLLIEIKGKEKYFPCKNLSNWSNQCFIIDPVDYAKAEDTGKILAVIHSHPTTQPIASQADMVSCEDTNLPGISLTQKQNNGVTMNQVVTSHLYLADIGFGV